MAETRTDDSTRRRDIIETARFLFQQRGFDQTTPQDIAARLGLNETTVATFFPSMDDLLEAVWSE